MTTEILTWNDAIKAGKSTQAELIALKLENFANLGWGGTNVNKWRGTASPNIGLDDQLPVGVVSYVDGQLAGMSFIIADDLPNYPLDGHIPETFTGEVPVENAANPWFAGHFVDPNFRRLGVARLQEAKVVEMAKELYNSGKWFSTDSRIWLFTEREPMDFLPEMYERSGWVTHRTFVYDGLMRWVMFIDLASV